MTDDPQLVLCPYCGHTQADDERCGECGGLFEPLSQRATQIAMGPWYVRDRKRPYHPGCSYEVLKKRIAAGGVRPNSVLRGPTTRQFWSLARNVPGVAHLLGYCHQCRTHVQPTDTECGQCGAPFVEYDERNELGIQFPTKKAAQAAQAKLDAELERAGIKPPARASAGDASSGKPASTAAQVGTANTASGDPLDLADNLLGDIIPKSKAPAGPPPFAAPNPPQNQTPAAQGNAAAAPAAKAPAKHPATPAGPTDDGDDDSDEGSSGISTTMLLVIGLIAINMIALIVILIMLAMNSGNTATPNSSPPPALAPTSDSPTSPGAMNTEPTDTPTAQGIATASSPAAIVSLPRPAAPQPPAATSVASSANSNATSTTEPVTTPTDPDRAAVARYFGDAP